MNLLIQFVINGLLVGGTAALIGMGFSLIWGILNIINLAHAAFIMIGAYLAWMIFNRLGLDPVLTVPVVMLVLFGIGYALQRGVINRVMRAPLLTTFLLTFGLETLLINFGLRIWTADTQSIRVPYSGQGLVFSASRGVFLGTSSASDTIVIPIVSLVSFAVALFLFLLVFLLMERTRVGAAIRAVGQDGTAARLMGIDIAHAYALTFGISAALAGAAGVLVAMAQGFSPATFGAFNIRAFIVVILGGLGSIPGALLGGLAFGLIDQFSQAPLPGDGVLGWTSLARVKDVIFFLILVLVLVVRPTGLLGRRGYR